ncbi:MAG TPA: type VI secretion system tube protein Hcp [Candidatus Saccharimonadia bacterium]|nr:type VI secretion system tube protein Hcp [Candidatus Saccharimonadia bacterium]
MQPRRLLLPLAILFGAGAPLPAHAALEMFLCVAGMAGDATSSGFSGCSNVVSQSENEFVDGSAPLPRDLRVTKQFDRMSPSLREALAAGTAITEASLRIRRASADPFVFWTVRLLDVRVTAVGFAAHVDDALVLESVALRGARIEWSHRRQDASGALLPPTVVCWNVAAQTATAGPCPP